MPVDLSSRLVWALFAVLAAVAIAVVRARGRAVLWSLLPSGLIVLATLLLVAVTASTFVIDALRTPGWTFARQNVNNAIGRADCGLIDEFDIPVPGSIHELGVASEASTPTSEPAFAFGTAFEEGGFPSLGYNDRLPLANMRSIGSWSQTTRPAAVRGGTTSDWYTIDPATDDRVALMVMGSFEDLAGVEAAAGQGNAVAIEWGTSDGSEVLVLGVVYPDLWRYFPDWALVLFEPPDGADRVRLLLRDDTVDDVDGWVASSMPLGVSMTPLASVLDGVPQPEILVTPPLMLFLPCIPIPTFDTPLVPAPDVMVLQRPDMWETTYASAASVDRYFDIPTVIAPDRDVDQIVFVFSQEYLTGAPARVNGEFLLVDAAG